MKCKRSSAGSVQGFLGCASVDFVGEKIFLVHKSYTCSLLMCSRETVNFSKLPIVMCSTINRLLKIMVIFFKVCMMKIKIKWWTSKKKKSSKKSAKKNPRNPVGCLFSFSASFYLSLLSCFLIWAFLLWKWKACPATDMWRRIPVFFLLQCNSLNCDKKNEILS